MIKVNNKKFEHGLLTDRILLVNQNLTIDIYASYLQNI